MDDPDCDSTWEDDAEDAEDEDAGHEDAEEPLPGALQSRTPGSRNWRAMQDLRRYRHHYPDLVEQDCNNEDMPNLSFYKNEICFLPNGCLIEELLEQRQSHYTWLEDNHSYIQWLFPLREPGVNWHAKPLTLREVEAFKSCPEVKERLVRAYELMLDFYGIQLQDRATGAVCRAQHYQKRFQNLNWRSHNNLRITRILKSLGELGLEHYQGPLVRFFLEETLVRHELPAVRQSALDYFVFAVRCPRQRRQLLRFAWEHFRPRNQFVWGPPEKLRRCRPPANALHEAGTQGQPERPEPNRDGDREPPSPQEDEAEEGDSGQDKTGLGEEARTSGEEQLEPPSPKESKKRKLEASRQEQTPEQPGGQSTCEVEAIVLNLEGCALSQGGQDPAEAGQPCSPPPGARLPEARKRRKVDQPGCLEAAEGRDEEDGAGSVGLQQGAPGNPAMENGAVADEAETESAKPGKL
ncbi:opioid growth factor receptor [Ochotona curzoniae]|uniref:opioid growth factor receptor n=1 Tax=Ochotona curzoniae TaxID=130825 RepID=UPI001B349D37|nr:opioid growth factor receptor [Ochotona curzoniae]